MKWRLLFVAAAILLSGTACSNAAERGNHVGAKAIGSSGAAHAATVAAPLAEADDAGAEGDVPLHWESYSNSDSVRLLAGGLKQAERVVKETSVVAAGGSRESKIVVYARKDDTDHLYGALVNGDKSYDLGEVAGYAYAGDDQVTVRSLRLFGKEVVKIQGPVGAAASISRYFELVGDVPKPLLTVTDGHASEADVDHDGWPEVVSSSGTSPYTVVYRWRDGRIERCALNDALKAEAVYFNDEGAVTAAFGQDQSRLRLYWLEEKGLTHIQSYSRKEDDFERFITIPYTREEALRIREQADGARVYDPYVPRKGLASDYVVDAKKAEDGTLKLTFPHFAIYQSRTDMRPLDQDDVVGEKRYFPDFTAEWIPLPDSEASGSWYFARGSTYFSISSAKSVSKDELLFVAASLAPLDELKLPDGTVPAADLPPQITREYLFALKAVNEFASAWSRRDPAAGLKWVSDEWKAGKKAEELDAYFRGTSNPHHLTFELSGKRQVDERTYLFSLRLYEYYTAQPDSVLGFPQDYGRGWIVEAVRVGENDWGEGVWRVNP
ncbi:hypothetical protein [Cohnella hongkongensis]|uniref:Lipoprotein n=1 Tax=Cohnella hongkongensis TaxID=178337 RepID=A0ABV9F5B8_9BACL